MRTRSSSNLPVESPPNPSTSNPKRGNRRRSKQHFILEESPVDTMADQRTMAELLRTPTEGYAEAIMVPPILAEQFELKHSLINMMTLDQFFGLEKDNPHDHFRWFNKITSTIKYKDVPNSAIKLMLFPFSLTGAARRWLEKEPPRSILTWEDLVSKFINEFFPPSRTTNILVPLSELEKVKKINKANMKAMQTQFNNVKNELRNEMKISIQASMSNLTNKLKNMMASFLQKNTASTSRSGSFPSNTIANPKGELKAITTRSGIVLDGPFVPIPPSFINPEEDERVEETLMDQDLAEYTIKVPPYLVQKPKPPYQRNFVVHQRDPLHPNIHYPSRMLKQKQQERNEVQIYKFWQMFKQLHINITLADALILILKYQKMLKALLSNKEKLLELANTPLNENCSAIILKNYLRNLETLRNFSFRVGSSPPYLGKTFLTDRSCLIDVHKEEMILRDDDERLTLNMRHDTSSYSNQPQKESINMINICDDSNDVFDPDHVLKPLFPSPIPVKDIDSFLESPILLFLCLNTRPLSIIRKRRIVAAPLLMLITLFLKSRVHVPNVLTTHPTLMLDSDFTPSDNSLPEYKIFYFDIEEKNSGSTTIHADIFLPDLKCFNFDFKPDPGELTSTVDSGIRENVLSATNVNLPPH
uniref:Reverse transcriptase domain-containing protein n=1 Tax=Tanacetum cinerariifolium TaxID=118510 RepID=A0A699H2M4_TANCI|nr:reverse transcriptase domain-containing protein [Tanacetum cinerariifolium]